MRDQYVTDEIAIKCAALFFTERTQSDQVVLGAGFVASAVLAYLRVASSHSGPVGLKQLVFSSLLGKDANHGAIYIGMMARDGWFYL